MKKLINTSFFYAIVALIGGVFYREFTKFNVFDGKTTLGFLHVHLFVLGMIFFLIVALFEKQYSITINRKFKAFYIVYNLGMLVTIIGLLWRGILQTLSIVPTKALSASISGISGIGHILLSIGIIMFFVILKKQAIRD